MTSATSATSEGAQGIFSKITFLKSVRSNKKDEVCHSFVVQIFTKSLHRGGVGQARKYDSENMFCASKKVAAGVNFLLSVYNSEFQNLSFVSI